MTEFSFTPEKSIDTNMACLNGPVFSTKDYQALSGSNQHQVVYVMINGITFQAKERSDCKDGKVYMNTPQRQQANVSLINPIKVFPVRVSAGNYVDEVLGELKLLNPIKLKEISTDDLFKDASSQLRNRPLYIGQQYLLIHNEQLIQFTPQSFGNQSNQETVKTNQYKILTQTSTLRFKLCQDNRKSVTLNGNYTEATVFKDSQLMSMMRAVRRNLASGSDEVDPQDEDLQLDVRGLGIGGCNVKFADIFRRVFVPRLLPPQFISDYQLQMVRGLILYGPPGTGKTLIARKIGEILNAKPPKIISGPEILNSYVGKSEENVRNLFKDAEVDYQKYGDDSELHIIILDEMDAICKQRGSRGDSTGTHDSIVNQFLAKMDGVEQLNNILVIGMTNRIDMLDDALLRPGRFEVQVHIGLPDRDGRLEILQIHTALLAKKGALDASVDLEKLAESTPNYSGAELRGLVTAGLSYAQSRLINAQEALQSGKNAQNELKKAEFKLTMRDLVRALDEVHPAFGRGDGDTLERVQAFGFWQIESSKHILGELLRQAALLRQGFSGKVSAFLIASERPGAGASSICAQLVKNAQIDFVRFVSAESLVLKAGSEAARSDELVRAFRDAYRVPEGIIILDCLEDILMVQQGGLRVGAAVINTIVPLLKRAPTGRLLVLATTTQLMALEQIGVVSAFQKVIHVSNLTQDDAQSILQQIINYSGEDQNENNANTVQMLKSLKDLSDNDIQEIANTTAGQPVRNFFRVLAEDADGSKITAAGVAHKLAM